MRTFLPCQEEISLLFNVELEESLEKRKCKVEFIRAHAIQTYKEVEFLADHF